MRRPFFFVPLVLVGIAIDLFTKWAAFHGLEQDYRLWPGVLHFTPAQNTGGAFSLLTGHSALILGTTLIITSVLAWIYYRSWRSASALLLWAIGLVLVGAIGNLLDRLAYGYVRDFIDFVPRIPLVGHWAIFNVADICVCVGVGLYLISELWLARRDAKAA
ncbi:MAG TPA: signal peptidase II [Planctomycetota bacterium]|jgi:signal peptidase II